MIHPAVRGHAAILSLYEPTTPVVPARLASQKGIFVVTGFKEIAPLRLEALLVAEEQDGDLRPIGEVPFGFAGRQL
jgi:hypothetical protein